MKTLFKTMPFLILFLMLISCEQFIQVPAPETQAEGRKIFSDNASALSATVGVYQAIANNPMNFCFGALTLYPGLSADELKSVNSSSTTDVFLYNTLLPTTSSVNNYFWLNPFKNLYHINSVLEGLNASATIAPAVKAQLEAEMLFMRALHYFYLVNVLGDVPLQKTTDYIVNGNMARTPAADVYVQIVSDLQLATMKFNESGSAGKVSRPGKEAAQALLARVYLYQENWSQAATAATEVIQSGKYALDAVDKVFLTTSKEAVFSLTKATANTAEGATFVPASATVRPTYVVTDMLLSAFEAGDTRKTNWLKANRVSGTDFYFPNKYKIRATTPITESYIVLRLAELYLIRAEARANQNNLEGAIDDVDMLRARAGLLKIRQTSPGISQADLLLAILKERRIELFAEWGHRWFDLKRTGNADAILGPLKGANWQGTDKLYPIPQVDMDRNTNLVQNPGYFN